MIGQIKIRTSGNEGKVLFQGETRDVTFFGVNPLLLIQIENGVITLVLCERLFDRIEKHNNEKDIFIYGK